MSFKKALIEQALAQFRTHISNTLQQAKNALAQAKQTRAGLAPIRSLLGLDIDAKVRFEKGKIVVESIMSFDLDTQEGRRSCLVAAEVFSKIFGVPFDEVAKECEPPESKKVSVE